MALLLVSSQESFAGHLFTQGFTNTPVTITAGTGINMKQMAVESASSPGNVSLYFNSDWGSGDSLRITIGNYTQTFSYDSPLTGTSQSGSALGVTDPVLNALTLSPTTASLSIPTTYNMPSGSPYYGWTIEGLTGTFTFTGYRIYFSANTFNGSNSDTINQTSVVNSNQLTPSPTPSTPSKTNITSGAPAGSITDPVFGSSGTHYAVFEGGTLTLDVSTTSTTTQSQTFQMRTTGTISVTNAGDVFTLTGVISDDTSAGASPGALTKSGSGTLILDGVNTYTGGTVVGAGTLLVGGTSNTSAATIIGATSVSSGATLGGFGTVGSSGSTLTNSGTVAPGGSGIGTLSVGGAYTQTSAGNLSIGLTPSSTDLLAITGLSSLAGNITIAGSAGTYSPTRYTLLTSSGRTGTFDSLTINSFTSLGHFLTYDANNVYLVLGPDSVTTTLALNRNFEQMKSLFASQSGLQISGLNYDCSVFGENHICLSTGGRTSHVFNRYDAFDSYVPMSTSALLIGAYHIDPTVRVGGWVDQNLYTQNANLRVSNSKPMFGVFSVYHPSGDSTEWQIKVAASYVEKRLGVTREAMQNTEAGYGSTTFRGLVGQLEVAYGFNDLLPDTVVSPFMGIRYQNSRTNDYTEDLTASVQAPITYSKFREMSRVALAGIKLDGHISSELTYKVSLGVETDLKRNTPSYAGSSNIYGLNSFDLQGDGRLRDTRGFAGIGLRYEIDKTQFVGLDVHYRQDQFRRIDAMSTFLSYTVGL